MWNFAWRPSENASSNCFKTAGSSADGWEIFCSLVIHGRTRGRVGTKSAESSSLQLLTSLRNSNSVLHICLVNTEELTQLVARHENSRYFVKLRVNRFQQDVHSVPSCRNFLFQRLCQWLLHICSFKMLHNWFCMLDDFAYLLNL